MNVTMINGFILTKPLEINAVQTQVKDGYASFKNKSTFQTVEVVCGTEKIKAGSKILLRSDAFVQQWSKARYDFNGQDVIMVPINDVLGIVE